MARALPRGSRLASAFAGALILIALPASGTYSITAVDTRTGTVGAAGASCVPYEVIVIYTSAPGHGAAAVQAGLNDEVNLRIAELLGDDVAPEQIVAEVTDTEFDPNAPSMQYGIADLAGRTAGYTGPLANPFASHQRGEQGDYALTVQGNFLTSERVLEGALEGFASGCDLAERLLAALEAAGAEGEGDARCVDSGIPAKSAFVAVDGPEGPLLRLSIPDVSPDNPVALLREELDLWREQHPCPSSAPEEPPDDSDTGSEEGSCSVGAGGAGRFGAWMLAVLLPLWAGRQRARYLPGGTWVSRKA